MIGKRAIGRAELLRKYRSYICQAAASVANGDAKPVMQPYSKQETLTSDGSHLEARLGARLTRS